MKNNVLTTMSNDKANCLLEVWGMSMADKLEIFPCQTKGTFTHARADGGRGGRKIGFNTNHYMCSHMRGRGAEAEREQNPLRKKWVQHPICRVHFKNRALQTIIVLKKWQIRPRPLRVCVNIPVVAERECQNSPASAPQPPSACVNVA